MGFLQDIKFLIQTIEDNSLGNRKQKDKLLWDILTSFRGPDRGQPITRPFQLSLKNKTTARIRGIICLTERGKGISADLRQKPLTAKEIKKRNEMLKVSARHFYNHYYEACEALKTVYCYDLLKETYVTHKPTDSTR